MIEVTKQATEKMKKSIASFKQSLSKVRTGRANPSLLEDIEVDYYGTMTPLNQVANLSLLDARTISVQPWEKSLAAKVEKAIREADLGLNPASQGEAILVPMPILTEERRKELVKLVRQEGESARVAIRNLRRDSNQQLKEALKSSEITEDDERRFQDSIQKITDTYIKEIEQILSEKEKELMS